MKIRYSVLILILALMSMGSALAAKSIVYYSGDKRMGQQEIESVEVRDRSLVLKANNQWCEEFPHFQAHIFSCPLDTPEVNEQALIAAVRSADEISVHFLPSRVGSREAVIVWEVGEEPVVFKSSLISDAILAAYSLLEDEILQAEESLKNVFKSITNPDLSYFFELTFLYDAGKTGFALNNFQLDLKSALDEFLAECDKLIVNIGERNVAVAGHRSALHIWRKYFYDWLEQQWVEEDTKKFALMAKFWIVDPNNPNNRTKNIATVKRYLDQYELGISEKRQD